MMRLANPSMRGFTLLEVLVALAVFAVLAITVHGRSGDVLIQSARLEERTFATWIAQDGLTEALIDADLGATLTPGLKVRQVYFAGRDWEVERSLERTGQPGLLRVEVAVYRQQQDGQRAESPSARLYSHLSVREPS